MLFEIHLTSFSQAKSLSSSTKAGVEQGVPASVIYWRDDRNTFTACSKKISVKSIAQLNLSVLDTWRALAIDVYYAGSEWLIG